MNLAVRNIRRYVIELTGAMSLFFLIVAARRWLVPLYPELKPWVIAAPILPVLLIAAAIWRGIAGADEYHKRNFLNIIAIGAFIVGVTSVIHPFLERAGLVPPLPYFVAWPVMASVWLIMGPYRAIRDGVATSGWIATLRQQALFLAIAAGVVLAYWLAALAFGWPHGIPALAAAFGFGAMIGAMHCAFTTRV